MKIVQVNYSDTTGGAARACLRINDALNLVPGTSQVLAVEHKSSNPSSVALSQSKLTNLRAKFLFASDLLISRRLVKARSIPFSLGIWGTDISDHPAVKQADILNLHWINHSFLSIEGIAKLAHRKKIVWTFHDTWPATGGCHVRHGCPNYLTGCGNCPFLKSPHPNDITHRLFEKKLKHWRDIDFTIVTPSSWLGGNVQKSPILEGKRVVTINNPIDTNVFINMDKAAAKRALGLPTDKKIILFGMMKIKASGHKGADHLADALELLRSSAVRDNVHLLVMGLSKEELNTPLPFETHFTGFVNKDERLAEIYSAADVFVAPYLEDNFPNTVLESLSCGTPVVGFNAGGIPEMVMHEKNGYLAAKGSAAELAAGMEWVLRDEATHKMLCSFSRMNVEQSYSYKVIGERYRNLYSELIKG